ncbi:ABC transporter permease [Cellulomonas humilata]|uniref:ABC transporter permease n=1 Tax=Cellulomonas humilata TaxID=144055 RepID=A0A7Y6A4N4_9CELL|nr:ABC transporter permease [Cellulomonas humilata]NUU19723.1 ABC transporter permease [Cellulomonas humilata]
MSAVLAEWTKLRSVPRWIATLVGAAVLTVGLSALGAAGGTTDINDHPNFVTGPDGDPVADGFGFAHRTVTGDVSVTVHVTSLTPTGARADRGGPDRGTVVPRTPWTDVAAGITLKDGTEPGSSYVSVLLTGSNGVRMQSDFTQDVAGTPSADDRWLRLTRTGDEVTGFESADGVEWQQIATMTPAAVPDTAEVGPAVLSAPAVYVARGMGGASMGEHPESAVATFQDVTVTPASDGTWRGTAVTMPITDDLIAMGAAEAPSGPVLTERSGTYTVTGSGKVGPQAPDDDVVEAALLGVVAGLMALICVGALFGTSEYRRGMIRTTFTAVPRRGQVLAAKATVLGAATFVLSLVAVVASFVVAVPILQDSGMAPPAFPTPSLTDAAVVRALVLTALFMTSVTLVALAVGMLVRRSAVAITFTIVLVVLPLVAGTVLPGTSPRWLMYTTLAGGLATLRAKPPTATLAEPWALIGPGAGITVVLCYAAAALGLAWWQLRRRDA